MAINTKEFTETIEVGLKANKTFTRFHLRYKKEGKSHRKLFDYSDKHWDKRTRITQAKADSIKAKTKIQETGAFDENSNIDHIAKLYFDLKCEKSQWTDDKYRSYELHVQPIIGKKKIKDLRSFHLDQVKKSMEHKGFNKQSKDGSSPRTIKKILIQILKPIVVYAYDNRAIERVPNFPNIKQTRKKKNKLAVNLDSFEFVDNKIKTLEWSDVDMLQNTYIIRAERNKIKSEQRYDLPHKILVALQDIQDDRVGLVFKSPKTKRMLSTPKKQLEKIKENSGIDNLTMHYFRHILVSAMGEMGVANTILSASLGHTNLDTVNQFYLSANHLKSSGIANQAIGEIINL